MNEARNLEFAGMVGGAGALIRAIPPSKEQAAIVPFLLNLTPKLRSIRDLGREILLDFQSVLDLSDAQQTDELLNQTLVRATWIVDSLGPVIKDGMQLVEKGVLPVYDWPPELVQEITALLDDFEDVQETIALGLSEEFKKELESARTDAQR